MKEKNVQTIINSSNFQQILLNIKNLFKYNFETHQFQNVSLTTRLNILFFQSWLEIFPSYFARQISPLSWQCPLTIKIRPLSVRTWTMHPRENWLTCILSIYLSGASSIADQPAKIIRNPWCHLNLPKLTLTSHNLKVSHSSPSLVSWGEISDKLDSW